MACSHVEKKKAGKDEGWRMGRCLLLVERRAEVRGANDFYWWRRNFREREYFAWHLPNINNQIRDLRTKRLSHEEFRYTASQLWNLHERRQSLFMLALELFSCGGPISQDWTMTDQRLS